MPGRATCHNADSSPSRSPLQVAHLCGIMRNYDSNLAELILLFPLYERDMWRLPAVVAAIKQPTESKGIKSDCLSKYMAKPRWIKTESKKSRAKQDGDSQRYIERERDREGEERRMKANTQRNTHTHSKHTRNEKSPTPNAKRLPNGSTVKGSLGQRKSQVNSCRDE